MKKLILILAIAVVLIFATGTTSVRNAKMTSKLTVFENLVTPLTSTYIELNGTDETLNYRDGDTRNDADLVYADTVKNDGILDLTSLKNTLGEDLSLSGQVVMAIKFKVEDDSAATFKIYKPATNPYPLFVSDTFCFTMAANQSILYKCDSVLAPVSASAKTLGYDSSNDSTALYVVLITADAYQ